VAAGFSARLIRPMSALFAPDIARAVAPHAPTLVMMPLVGLAVLLIIIGAVVTSYATNKTTGVILLFLGFLLGAGAFFIMYRTEMRRP
jgi:hypothetical protein